ncbi:aldo/keto reductase [Salmonella enterica subsp. enterica]|nr:aldo/keto reductase [Salmonella enterica]EBF8126278.1 aldo/keto reductase [Salmonella enterica subsp. enterica]EBG5096436.1 aldo/keto reductase [Salmonella enterica subsp. enterica serovar India]EBY5128895.1 aldo/keto reductase [Salmonella enterica subsp. enterica serovar Brazzaville]EEF3250027.1 aldo/keto reductase [Salmonella enterica subsp. enterica serovar Abony]
MKMIPLGNTDIALSRMGLGTWAIGGGPAWNGNLDMQVCIDTIVEAHRCSINLIDTAPGYNFGNSEVIVGQALKKLPRNEMVVETKCGIVWEREGSLFNKVGDRQLYKNLSPDSIRKEVDASLQRLGIDYIDIYMTHWQSVPPFFTPIAETVGVLNELKAEGKIRSIGAANVDVSHIREYLKHGELDIIQAKYSILDRALETELLPLCREHGIVVQVYSPLEQGLLTGTITRDYVPGGARANKLWFQRENMLRVIDMLEKWQPLCDKYHCAVPTLALAWILRQSELISILSGATSPEQVRENIAALSITLTDDDALLMRQMAEALDNP